MNHLTLLCARHAQTRANVERVLQGRWDTPLTPLGERQAERLASWLTGPQQPSISRIVSGDHDRCERTVLPLLRRIRERDGAAPSYVRMSEFNEVDHGEFEGKPRNDASNAFRPRFYLGHEAYPGGESIDQLDDRLRRGITLLCASAQDGDAICLVSSGAALQRLIAWARHLDAETASVGKLQNAAPFALGLEWNGTTWRSTSISDPLELNTDA